MVYFGSGQVFSMRIKVEDCYCKPTNDTQGKQVVVQVRHSGLAIVVS